jgi:transcriptional regulator GlxA family with amidase domain
MQFLVCKDNENMKMFFRKLFPRARFSGPQKKLLDRIGIVVDRWVREKGFTKPLSSVGAVAADIGVPADQLNLFVRLSTRQTVLSWRKDLRIREARRLILEFPHLPLSTIGEMVGIDDKSNFKRQFADVVGMPPRMWREKHLR